ncbi:MAG: hypothetical protein V5B78_07555 [Desulfohalobiaceae bacterium]
MSEETTLGVRNEDKLAPLIGQDFLTWLWYTSEVRQGEMQTSQGEVFTLVMEQRISVQGGEGESRDTAQSSGPRSQLWEAMQGLKSGKKVNQARIKIEVETEVWQLQLKAEDFSVSGLKTPKVQTSDKDDDEDPDAAFLEKIYLMERAFELVDDLFGQFLRLRMSEEWSEERRRIRDWIKSL